MESRCRGGVRFTLLLALAGASLGGCQCFTPVVELSHDGGADAGCASETIIDATHGGPASALLRDGALHVLFQAADAGDVLYARCGPACDLARPRFSPPVNVGAGTSAPGLRPQLGVTTSGVVTAVWRTDPSAGELRVAECAAGCEQPSSWTSVALELPPTGTAAGDSVGLAVSGERRVLVAMRGWPPTFFNQGVLLAECETACASAPSAWSTFTLVSSSDAFGASVALQPLGGGGLRRLAVWGGGPVNAPAQMLYRECTQADWSDVAGAFLEPGVYPSVVVGGDGLPRVFFLSRGPDAALKVARCTQAPCATPMPAMWSPLPQWTTTTLETSVGHFSAGVLPDGRTAYVTSAPNKTIVLGVESQDGGAYEHVNPASCAEWIPGELPVTVFDAKGAAHTLVTQGTALAYYP